MPRILSALVLAGLFTGLSPAQTAAEAADPKAKFELADVHASAPKTDESWNSFAGHFELRGITMLDLISQAYDTESAKVMGGPAWLNTNKYDIIAKAPSQNVSNVEFQIMFQNLLAERFKLVVRKENRDLPVYLLTVAKKGAKLTPAAKEGPPTTRSGTGGDPSTTQHVVCESFKMPDLAMALTRFAPGFVDHPAIDETGLTGAYDFQLDWMGRGVYNRAKANPDGPPAIGINEALDKFGLKLEPGKRALPVLVVDSVNEAPTPNAPGLTIPRAAYPTEFDIAEVRPAKAAPANPGPWGTINFQRGQVQFMGSTLKAILAVAFDEQIERITGPKWVDEDRFDIIAKAPGNAREVPFDALKVMLQNLVVKRFSLETHKEEQPTMVFVLLAKKPKLKASDGTARSECKPVIRGDSQMNGILACQNTTMAQFAERLPNYAGAYIHPPMLDLTGLSGAYDFEISWTAKRFLPGQPMGPAAAPGAPADAATLPGDITVFEALDRQLGLTAREEKHPQPVLVIDKASQHPSEN